LSFLTPLRKRFLAPAKILIIDTELPTVLFLEHLRRVRIENLMSTTDFRPAFSLFQEFRPELVLIDWPYQEKLYFVERTRCVLILKILGQNVIRSSGPHPFTLYGLEI
jgi:hypothetical protein